MAKVENIKLEEFIEKMTTTIANTMITTEKILVGENRINLFYHLQLNLKLQL